MATVGITEQVVKALHEAARSARNETEFRLAFEPELKRAIAAADWQVELSVSHEKHFAHGFADSVFGQVVMEYKAPGSMGADMNNPANRTAREELQRYLRDHVADSAEGLKRSVGVALDGRYIFFLRWYSDPNAVIEDDADAAQKNLLESPDLVGEWRIEGPYEVNEQSVAQMLHYLRALARKRLTPEALADDFGPDSVAARAVVNALYEAFQDAEHPKVETMFEEWDRIFGIVYGQDIKKAVDDAKELGEAYEVDRNADLKPLLFCVHTYFALFIKLLVAELMSQRDPMMPSFVGGLTGESRERLEHRLRDLEEGGIFAQLGITNFLEGDFFGWFLETYSERLDEALRTMLRTLQSYEPATPTFMPEETRDLLKRLYQFLVPKKLRHDLGEYYTPDWLAELVLNEVGYEGDPEQRVLDPACGSGAFLVLTIRRVREVLERRLLDPAETLNSILANVVGFDLNPLAVIAARANYLLALGDLLNYRTEEAIRIPVYLCDSILTPTQEEEQGRLIKAGMRLRTVVGHFDIPEAVVGEGRLEELADCLERCVRDGYPPDEFLSSVRSQLGLSDDAWRDSEQMLRELFVRLSELEEQGRNRIWARLIKNAFAPLFQPKFDYVVGNPPWINWESLSQDYRDATHHLWVRYGLFTLKGHEARLGGGKKDISMLFAYACTDRYLCKGGRLGFLINQTVFQTGKAGEGFRRFLLPDRTPLGLGRAHDLVALQPFEGASNWTAAMSWEVGKPVDYPVQYVLWRKGSRKVAPQDTLDQAMSSTERLDLLAQPVVDGVGSPWLTVPEALLPVCLKAVGPSKYEAHAGLCTWADGVYLVEVTRCLPSGLLMVRNLAGRGKKDLDVTETAVEPDLLYPFAEWKAIRRYDARPGMYVFLMQDPKTRTGVDEQWLRSHLPKTYSYFKKFEAILRDRSGYKKYFDPGSDAFYTMYNVAEYSLAPHRTIWRTMGARMQSVALETVEDTHVGSKPPQHKNTVVQVQCASREEATYLAAVMNSAPVDLLVRSFSVSGGKSFGATSVLDYVAVPEFDPASDLHQLLAELSMRAHELAPEGEDAAKELTKVEEDIDRAAAELWGITKRELGAIKKTLKELS